MHFNIETGTIEITSKLVLSPNVTQSDLLSMTCNWEEWVNTDGVVTSFRALINLPNKNINPQTILIVHVGPDHPIGFWQLSPWDLVEGRQSRPEGKCTRRLRAWFSEMFQLKLPIGGDWGHADASYDPWNQTASIVCNYQGLFSSEQDWLKYRSANRF